jgi:hypothetical protein
MDALALAQRMKADTTQTVKIDFHGRGPDHCVFVLRSRGSPQEGGGDIAGGASATPNKSRPGPQCLAEPASEVKGNPLRDGRPKSGSHLNC